MLSQDGSVKIEMSKGTSHRCPEPRHVSTGNSDLWLANLNCRGLRYKTKRDRLTRDLQSLGVNICCIQETHLIASDYVFVLSRRCRFFSAYTRYFLDATCSLAFADPASRLCVLDVTIKFQFIGVYAPNDYGERKAFFGWIDRVIIPLKQEFFPSDWNAIFDPT